MSLFAYTNLGGEIDNMGKMEKTDSSTNRKKGDSMVKTCSWGQRPGCRKSE